MNKPKNKKIGILLKLAFVLVAAIAIIKPISLQIQGKHFGRSDQPRGNRQQGSEKVAG